MPRIFDNLSDEGQLLRALLTALEGALRADFCVGYFNLRGWERLADAVDGLAGELIEGERRYCRLLIGMQGREDEAVERLYRARDEDDEDSEGEWIDNAEALRRKRAVAESFYKQLSFGLPSEAAEKGLRRLVEQLRSGRLQVKVFTAYPLHAKLYLTYHDSERTPIIGYLGSSNLTLAGLGGQGELNVEELDGDTGRKLAGWFADRWADRHCLEITQELIEAIEASWAREALPPPYLVYLKMLYHLSEDARLGIYTDLDLPPQFYEGELRLLKYQAAAVKLVVRHIERRGGAILGDVVGLGKTLMAMAVAAVFHQRGLELLIVCPKNLVGMWENYLYRFQLPGKVIALSLLQRELQGLPRYRLLIVDESHNFRNPEGKRYAALRDYIQKNECRCLLLSATPYNKSYGDLAAQLGLFIDDDADIGVRPERYIKALGGESMAMAKHQGRLSSLAAFRASTEADDWRELMRLYLVRRTRHFILENYAETDPLTGRRYLERHNGERFYFPLRRPRTVTFESGADDPYAQLYSDEVVAAIESLYLPRYGLGQYVIAERHKGAPEKDRAILNDLSKAGKRLMGFCRTNLFKRLESSGESFLRSVRRHVLRNYVFLYALEKGLPLPIGTLDALAFDSRSEDRDEALLGAASDDESEENVVQLDDSALLGGDQDYRRQAERVYEWLQKTKRFKWIEPRYFKENLAVHLRADCDQLSDILRRCGPWQAERDTKLKALLKLIEAKRGQKMLIFSQFADTVEYLIDQLERHGVRRAERVTGESEDPTAIIKRFSPISNGANIPPESEIDILIATDVLSEGQNLQDASIVVNFDLPWAIIRLVQRAGRVDRIGQRADAIDCYSFMPAEGVEKIIRLRSRVRQRLAENQEVIGSDEQFFEDEASAEVLRELYTERGDILDDDQDEEVDLTSYAYELWQAAVRQHKALTDKVERLPNMVYSGRHFVGSPESPQGVLVYTRNQDGYDALVYFDQAGQLVTRSPLRILKLAECAPQTPAQARHPQHHALVAKAVVYLRRSGGSSVGALGGPRELRRRLYDALLRYHQTLRKESPLFKAELEETLQEVYHYPLLRRVMRELRQLLGSKPSDEKIAEAAIAWRRAGGLCDLSQRPTSSYESDPRLLCSLGLFELPTA